LFFISSSLYGFPAKNGPVPWYESIILVPAKVVEEHTTAQKKIILPRNGLEGHSRFTIEGNQG
jgi:hypothetical protein